MSFDDLLSMDGWRDETDLEYCPRCGSELEGTRPVKCPDHGPVSITYQEVPSDEELMESLFGDDTGGDTDDDNPFGFLDDLANEIEDPDGQQTNPRENVRERITRLFGRE